MGESLSLMLLFTVIGLVLVLEGIMPFLSPRVWKRFMRGMLDLDDKTLRVVGLISMLAGLAVLYLVHH